jgi:glutamate synthase (NADPH/NADH) small chain
VTDAIKFIYDLRNNDYSKIAVGDKVAVIGMGMTAIDAATQAKRLGASEVHLVYRRTQDEMPCTEKELNIAKLDGCNIIWHAAPKEIIGNGENVSQLVCDVMELGSPDASGKPNRNRRNLYSMWTWSSRPPDKCRLPIWSAPKT